MWIKSEFEDIQADIEAGNRVPNDGLEELVDDLTEYTEHLFKTPVKREQVKHYLESLM